MARITRARPNKRMLRLVAVVVLVLAVAFGVRQLTCSDGGTPASGGTTNPDGGTPVEMSVGVGEPFTVSGMAVVITSFYPAEVPTRPRWPVDTSPPPGLASGQVYYQAFGRASNDGDAVVRIDPLHFSLDVGGAYAEAEPTLTGPGPRSLLKGATFDFIVTFRGPAGLTPKMAFRPPSGGTVIIEGLRLPEGMIGSP